MDRFTELGEQFEKHGPYNKGERGLLNGFSRVERTYREPKVAEREPPPRIHYVLVLDHSGSMGGKSSAQEQAQLKEWDLS